MSREWSGKYQCYLHVQKVKPEGSNQRGSHIIISGHGETDLHAKKMFDHALEAYLKEFKEDE